MKLKEDAEAGKDVRLNLENARRTLSDLQGRLEGRKKELQSMRHVVNGTPVVLGGALVVPAGLMNELRGDEPRGTAASFASDAAARIRIEQLAMRAVQRAEECAAVASSTFPPRSVAGICVPTRPPLTASSPTHATSR